MLEIVFTWFFYGGRQGQKMLLFSFFGKIFLFLENFSFFFWKIFLLFFVKIFIFFGKCCWVLNYNLKSSFKSSNAFWEILFKMVNAILIIYIAFEFLCSIINTCIRKKVLFNFFSVILLLRVFFYKHNAYKHMNPEIWIIIFCYLVTKRTLKKKKY